MFKILSTTVVLLIIAGLVTRKQTRAHISLMLSAFVLDIGLLLAIEFQRNAINTALNTTLKPILFFHICVSVLMIIFYVIMIRSGMATLKDRSHKARHKNLAKIFLLLKFLNYTTSFMI